MELEAILAIIALILMTPIGVLSMIVLHRGERWWAMTSERRTIKRIGKLREELSRLQTIRLYQMLIPFGGFMLLIINTITLMISTAYISLLFDLRLHAIDGPRQPEMSIISLRVVRFAPVFIGAVVNLYATWFVRRYALRLPAYKARVEREMATLQSSLSPNLSWE
jgi:hypothetical protein